MMTMQDIPEFQQASTEDLKTLRGIIYLIINVLNGKCYIGSSYRTFKMRYPFKKWYNKHHNPPLLNAVNFYGEANFKICILESGVREGDLAFMETFYISLFNCKNPHGYNLRIGELGVDRFLKRKKKALSSAKNYTLIDYNGKIHEIFNLKQFCKDSNLKYHGMRCMAAGDNKTSQGFAVIGTIDPKDIPFPDDRKVYELIGPNGEEYLIIGSPKEFIKNNSLPSYFYQMLSGRYQNCEGWRLKHRIEKPKLKKFRKYSEISIIDSNNNVLSGRNLKELSEKANIDRKALTNLVDNRKNTIQGWRLLSVSNKEYNINHDILPEREC